MPRFPKRLLVSAALATSLMLFGTPAAFADPGNGNSANAPGQNKDASTSQQTAAPQSSTSNNSSQGNSNHSQGNAGTSGTYNQPQPYSTADQNNTGANTTSASNPYASTRNGSPSLNGNGNGQATGKPCAGCVGKADNKNPKGQFPNGTDRNAGYECDRNHGIGRSNPAHTGCAAAPITCLTNCGGKGGCTVNCGPGSCQTNCTSAGQCVSSAMTSCTPGRGAGSVLGLSTSALTGSGSLLPNTSGASGINWSLVAAIASLLALPIYWRQFIAPKLPRPKR